MALRDVIIKKHYSNKTVNGRMAIMEAIVNLNRSNFRFWDDMDSYKGEHYLKLSQMDDGSLLQMLIDRAIDMAWEHDADVDAYKKMYRKTFNN